MAIAHKVSLFYSIWAESSASNNDIK